MTEQIVTDNSAVIVALEKRIRELEKTIKSLTDGVTHFHKSHGDMNPLLEAYIKALKDGE